MGRPKIQNPKNKHIGIVTTEEKYRRFKALGLIGDEAIDVLLFHLEKGDMELNVKKSQSIKNIKSMKKQIENLEFEILKEETRIEEINQKIGVNATNGLRKDIDKAINNVMQRYNNQCIFNIYEFVEDNKEFIKAQAYLCNITVEEFNQILIDNVED